MRAEFFRTSGVGFFSVIKLQIGGAMQVGYCATQKWIKEGGEWQSLPCMFVFETYSACAVVEVRNVISTAEESRNTKDRYCQRSSAMLLNCLLNKCFQNISDWRHGCLVQFYFLNLFLLILLFCGLGDRPKQIC